MPDTCWESTVDMGRFRAWVTQDGDGYRGLLRVVVVEDGTVILERDVAVSYAARFGPDMDDVATWQEIALEAIDTYIAERS